MHNMPTPLMASKEESRWEIWEDTEDGKENSFSMEETRLYRVRL